MKYIKVLLIVLLICMGFHSDLLAWDELRDMETITIYGRKINQLVNTPVDSINVYAFSAHNVSWHKITWQIDERDSDGGYYGTKNYIFDENEEILIMAKDAGDRAEQYFWIENEDSKNNIRYEIEISDPLDSSEKKYFYIYKSSTFERDSSLPQYIVYFPHSKGDDKIEGLTYSIEHIDGIPRHLKIPVAAGGMDKDILDRQKARVNGHNSIIGDIKITEDDLDDPKVSYLLGPIRLTRKVKFTYKVKYLGVTIYSTDMSFSKQYYPHFVHHVKAAKKLDKDWGISLIRQSFDFNLNAIGMEFYNHKNHLQIDGVKDDIDRHVHLAPDYNWYLVTGEPGSIVNIFQVEDLGSTQELYYWDNEGGGTYDGTKETGYDKKSYSDVGVLMKGSDVEGYLGLPMHLYFMAANQDSTIGPELLKNFLSPLSFQPQTQDYVLPVVATTLPDTSEKQGVAVAIPVMVEDVSNYKILSADIKISYDNLIVNAIDASTAGTITASWGEPSTNVGSNYIDVHLEGATQLEGAGKLLYLEFKVIGVEGTQSLLHFEQMVFNDGGVLADTYDGSITALAPPELRITLPDTSQEKGLPITIPVRVSDAAGLDVTLVQIGLTYNTSVLDVTGASTANTIASSWGEPSLTKNTNGLELSMSGTSGLMDAGVLVYLNFNVTGESGQTTSLSFENVVLNEGIPVAIPRNGFFTTLAPPEVVVSLPDTSQEKGLPISIPVRVSEATGLDITSLQLNLTYNTSVLDATGASTANTITGSWEEPSLTKNTNGLQLSMAGTSALVGAGEVVYLNFDVIGEPGQTTTLSFENVIFNEGRPVAVLQNGLFSTLAPPEIMVSISDTAAEQRFAIDVPIHVQDVSGLNINFVSLGLTYNSSVLNAVGASVEGTIAAEWDEPISSGEPGVLNIEFSGSNPLSGSGNLVFISFDVIGNANDTTSINFSNIKFNNGNPAGIHDGGLFTVLPARIDVTLPDTAGVSGTSISIPVIIEDVTGLDVLSIISMISYEPQVLDAVAVRTEGTIAEEWGEPTFRDFPNRAHIKMSGSEPLQGAGILFFIDFDIIGPDSSSSPLRFMNFLFNSGLPIAEKQNGLFTVNGIIYKVVVNIPDTSAYEQRSLKLPILVDDLTGMDVNSVDIKLLLNPKVAEATAVTSEGTLTALWENFSFKAKENSVSISMSGTTPLRGEGTLFFVDFDINGKAGTSTEIHFEKTLFNDGHPITLPDDGLLTVLELPRVTVSLPDTSGMSNSSISLPINVDDLSGLEVMSFNTEILIDPQVLDVVGVTATGTLTSQWDEPEIQSFADKFIITMQGETPLEGSGPLLYVDFDVIGSDSSTSPLKFENFIFNDGVPDAVLNDGLFTINGVVPVELISFEGEVQHNKVKLSWTTLSESNNYGFEVQRSSSDINNIQQWEKIEFVPGNGTTTIPHIYVFYDKEISRQTYYYRLKQIDYDGKFSYSSILTITINKPLSFRLEQNFPNPFNANTLIRYQVPEHGYVELRVYNLLGNEVNVLVNEKQAAGFYTVEWNGQNFQGKTLSSGVYIYQLKAKQTIITKKMILLE